MWDDTISRGLDNLSSPNCSEWQVLAVSDLLVDCDNRIVDVELSIGSEYATETH